MVASSSSASTAASPLQGFQTLVSNLHSDVTLDDVMVRCTDRMLFLYCVRLSTLALVLGTTLNCVQGSTYLHADTFCYCDLDINPMTLKLEGDLDILKMYLHIKNEVARLRHSKLLMVDEIYMANEKKYENSSQGQSSRSNVTNF